MATKSEAILQGIVESYQRTDRDYRDGLLHLGRRLHEYVLAFLSEGDELSEVIRLRGGYTRRAAVQKAAEALEVKRFRINEMIGTAMFVDIIGHGIDLGGIGYTCLTEFRRFVKRKVCGRHAHAGQGNPPSNSETWEVRGDYEAADLLRQAIAKKWDAIECRRRCSAMLNGTGVKPRKVRQTRFVHEEEAKTQWNMESSIAIASPGDAAKLLFSMVEKSSDPGAVALRLRVMLERLIPRKKAMA